MPCDYDAIRSDNERRYGSDIGRIGPMLLAERYDDRTHFIFELLQNAEDAIARRKNSKIRRAVSFDLTSSMLRFSHFGVPFDEDDVRGVCGIAESTKDLTAIGRFGIGFKSVYAYTDRPEIHSGAEDFAIESFVWPAAVPALERDPDETIILVPLKENDGSANDEIARGLEKLGAFVLLFLREIEEIHWSTHDGRSGLYLRDSEALTEEVRRVTVIGQEQSREEVFAEWLVFAHPVATAEGTHAGHVEIAFLVDKDQQLKRESIKRVDKSPLVVFFPTVVETHLGFVVQGPYRTTPSRDNVPRGDTWNQSLVVQTMSLLRASLGWLREHDLLDTATLRCMPLDPTKFGEGSMFRPLYEATVEAFTSDSILPRFDSGHIPARIARLARTQELRDLLTPAQLSDLYDEDEKLVWLSGDITQDRTPELRRYLMQELGVPELTPESVVPRLDQDFLEAQPDEWIVALYEFLAGQPGLRRRYENLALTRLENGTHVTPMVDGQPQVFLPGPVASGFPVVRGAVCTTETSLEFLQSLGLTWPDPVDDVVRNLLPKYRGNQIAPGEEEYKNDIERVLNAFRTDSKAQREKLVAALRETPFVKTVEARTGSKSFSEPTQAYLATERLKSLFAGVEGVVFVDDEYDCLRGEDVRELLEASGAARYLQPIPTRCPLSWEQKAEVRRRAGLERSTWDKDISDVTLRGLDALLVQIPAMDLNEQRRRSGLLWDALADVENRRGSRVFDVEYTWGYSQETKTVTVDAAFIGTLNERNWVPDTYDELRPPASVMFDSLGWKTNTLLQSKIRFKPPILDQLAREAGIEPGVLELLKKLGVTSEAELRDRLGVSDEGASDNDEPVEGVEDAIRKLLGETPRPTPPAPDPYGPDTPHGGSSDGNKDHAAADSNSRRDGSSGNPSTKRGPGSAGGRPFISYVGIHPDENQPDPDGLEHNARMALEERAIRAIITREPAWQRTKTHNPGFDLYVNDAVGTPIRWCEVKAMSGSLDDRPVGLSRKQFEHARDHGGAFWLYIVEFAGMDHPRIVRVQDPVGHARTFTFDHGWRDIAIIDTDDEQQEE